MRVALTGTPGTGKTTVASRLETDLDVVHLNDVIREAGLHEGRDAERGSLVADVEALRNRFADHEDVLLESHLAHHLPADRVVVLRCHPRQLRERLLERTDAVDAEGGYTDADGRSGPTARSADENAEAEALDVILGEAVSIHGPESVYEIDTTDRPPADVEVDVAAAIAGDRSPAAGEVDFTDYL